VKKILKLILCEFLVAIVFEIDAFHERSEPLGTITGWWDQLLSFETARHEIGVLNPI